MPVARLRRIRRRVLLRVLSPPRPGGLTRADLLLRGGPIFDWPACDALAVAGGRILAIGTSADLAGLVARQTRIVELAGRPVWPGFVDAHTHLECLARGRRELDLEGLESIEAIAAAVARRAAVEGPEWIVGRGWLRDRLHRWPSAADLDRASPARPVALFSHDTHALWVSSPALERAGLTPSVEDPPGGRFGRGADGSLDGLLFESAQAAILPLLPTAGPAERLADLQAVLAEAARLGLVGVCNFEGSDALELFRLAHSKGALTLRVTLGPGPELLEDSRRGDLAGADEWLSVGLIKLFADGALGSRTASMLEPYADGAGLGVARLELDELVDLVRRGRARGLGVATHAIGDAAVRLVLDAYEVARRDPRPAARRQVLRVEHAQLVHPTDRARFAALGVVASMQPNHCPADWPTAERGWGRRCEGAYSWRSLLEAGAHLALGTDAPVEPLDPLLNLHAAVTRQDRDGRPPGGWYPDERLTLDQAIRAYTSGSARAVGPSAATGELRPGHPADLVVLSEPVRARPADALLRAEVDLTMVGGRIVHERS